MRELQLMEQSLQLEKFKLEWRMLTNEEMPEVASTWSFFRIQAALRLLKAGFVKWSDERGRLLVDRTIHTDDQSHWNDCIRCEVGI